MSVSQPSAPMDLGEAENYDDDGPVDREEEGEGDVVMPGVTDDSSEEEDEDEEEERRIREGFIVDEDEDEDEAEDDPEEERRRRRKRRKKRHRQTLEEDDLDLLEENTGTSFKRNHRLTRLRRGSSSRRNLVQSSEEEDLDDTNLPTLQDIHDIWDDERGIRDYDDDVEDMGSFIETDEEEEAGGAVDEKTREERRRQKRRQQMERKKGARGANPELVGIDANAWQEIHEVFGDGHDYDWALVEDEEDLDEQSKPEMKIHDVFEPSEIQARHLTDDDDLIRVRDIPERMQLLTSSLSRSSTLAIHTSFTVDDLNDAALWITPRLSFRKTQEFFSETGKYHHLRAALIMAVTFTVKYLFLEEYEVPYIWTHKRDHISHFDPNDIKARVELLSLAEIWQIYALGQKYRSFLERKRAFSSSLLRYDIAPKDYPYVQEVENQLESVEMVADATEWLNMAFKPREDEAFRFHDDDSHDDDLKKPKMPSRVSVYDITKKSIISRLAQGFGIQPHEIVVNFIRQRHVHFIEDQDLNPSAYAEQFVDPDPTKALQVGDLLRRARLLVATELGKDPLLRSEMRKLFKEEAHISVEPTERGAVKITDLDPYFSFKYLHHKPIGLMLETSQFLHILDAESQRLVKLSIHLPPDAKAQFERRLVDAFSSDSFSEAANAWNAERGNIVHEALEDHLIPAGIKWTREYIREEVEDSIALRCAGFLRERINAAPFKTQKMDRDQRDIPSVVAMSMGKGDPLKDAIAAIFMDEDGRMLESTKLDNLDERELQDEFIDLLRRRQPDVIVIGGLSMNTTKLSTAVKILVTREFPNGEDACPVIFVHDDIARIYQHSERAKAEFNALSLTAKYCVALARYVQSPLNEFASLGEDIAVLPFGDIVETTQTRPDHTFVPRAKLLTAYERTIVDVTNSVGVDINRAVTDTYYRYLLPFICGLGPRKADALIQKIVHQTGGTLVNRIQFVKAGLLTTKIFLNAAGFLRIKQEQEDMKYRSKSSRIDEDNTPDPLDDTRIHPEDYELARKMATDALELDEEDTHDEHPSHVVTLIMADKEKERKISELNLDEFAVSLYEANEDKKRHTLNLIRDELLKPFSELRQPFLPCTAWQVLTMLSGETPQTLKVGYIVTVQVLRVNRGFTYVRLDSGIEGIINDQYLYDSAGGNDKTITKNQFLPGVIIDLKFDLQNDAFKVELSARPSDVIIGDHEFRRVRPDVAWDQQRYERDQEMQQRKKRAEVDKSRRVIKHPNFHNFNTAQAEAYLDKQQRGDVVVRPSSKGPNHLAVTWKVDHKLYQHIDVTELNADSTGQGAASQLVVDSAHSYADLDELIVNHVQAMARRVEELMAHERFKQGSEDELHKFLKNQLLANPAKSMYGFTLNRKRPGHFNLCFLANKNASVQTWPIRVAPEAYYLFEAPAVGVLELCDAFKVRHLHETQNLANMAGGKTPYGAGARTPGHASVRQVGRTPNPYGGATPGTNPSNFAAHTFGYQTPSRMMPSNYQPQMTTSNPERPSITSTTGTGWQRWS